MEKSKQTMKVEFLTCNRCGHVWAAKIMPSKTYYQCARCKHAQRLEAAKELDKLMKRPFPKILGAELKVKKSPFLDMTTKDLKNLSEALSKEDKL